MAPSTQAEKAYPARLNAAAVIPSWMLGLVIGACNGRRMPPVFGDNETLPHRKQVERIFPAPAAGSRTTGHFGKGDVFDLEHASILNDDYPDIVTLRYGVK